MTRFSVLSSEDSRTFFEFNFRTALYDALNPEIARPRDSELLAANTVVRPRESRLSLRTLDIFSVSSLAAAKLDLPGMSSLAWKIRLGLRSQNLSCENCLVAGLDGGVGYSFALVPTLGGFIDFTPYWRAHVSLSRQFFLDGVRNQYNNIEFENRFGLGGSWDIRLSYLDNVGRYGRASVSLYW